MQYLGCHGTGSMIKRAFDIAFALTATVALAPIYVVAAMAVKLDSPGPAFYCGTRVGRHGMPFKMYKFRTMVEDAALTGSIQTAFGDPRITKVGRFLRKFKIDEWPQYFNVLKGEMSVVGPRPELQECVDLFTEEEREILSVRPGITDWATIWIGDEEERMAGSDDPLQTYMDKIWPEKHRLQLDYVRNNSVWIDVKIVFQTIKLFIVGRSKNIADADPSAEQGPMPSKKEQE
jgi:lipopolysaccharide/colanic/teichoic acid biosynthesis glycosyltransferase